eukprot:TRINITY_DN3564_c0_g3_i3.p2 TRINITY_DN3564_c0_g3~~TRINITY_DN3564_c0_g3_i3.p2  ORF type:complete len:131 (+),score=32.19 TRINITY_DN3564_c0_g3_i3:573-965(+)
MQDINGSQFFRIDLVLKDIGYTYDVANATWKEKPLGAPEKPPRPEESKANLEAARELKMKLEETVQKTEKVKQDTEALLRNIRELEQQREGLREKRKEIEDLLAQSIYEANQLESARANLEQIRRQVGGR